MASHKPAHPERKEQLGLLAKKEQKKLKFLIKKWKNSTQLEMKLQ